MQTFNNENRKVRLQQKLTISTTVWINWEEVNSLTFFSFIFKLPSYTSFLCLDSLYCRAQGLCEGKEVSFEDPQWDTSTVVKVAIHPHRVLTYRTVTTDSREIKTAQRLYCLALPHFPAPSAASVRERWVGWRGLLSVPASPEAAQMRTTWLTWALVSVEIKRTIAEAQRTLLLPHSR